MPLFVLKAVRMTKLVLFYWLLAAGLPAAAQAPVKQWDRTLGGTGDDRAISIQPTTDGGYIVGGTSTSGNSGDKSQPNTSPTGTNYWVAKLDSAGTKQWDRTFGGVGGEELRCVIQTADHGYLLGGYSASGATGDKSQPSRGNFDMWIIKLDASGNKTWDRTFGGLSLDDLAQLQQTSDGGYILGGYSFSGVSGDKTQTNRGPSYTTDYWIVKIDANGTKQWDRTVGGTASEELRTVCQTADGGYLVAGSSWSDASGDKAQDRQGLIETDFWIVKLDANGAPLWNKDFGTVGWDVFGGAVQTADGGYLVAGNAGAASGDKTVPGKGALDIWLLKLSANGTKQWDRAVGGANDDFLAPNALAQTPDGGYVIAASSFSGISGDRTLARRGSEDYWLVKLDAAGTPQWDQAMGSSLRNELYGMRPTSRNGFVLCGYSNGGTSLDKTQPSRGGNDFWVVKLGPPPPSAAIGGDSVLCAGGSARLTVTPPALTYRWSTGATTAGISVSQPGSYSVQATYANGASSTARFQVRLLPAVPAFSLGPDTTICEGTALVLHGPAPALPGLAYAWSDGSNAPALTVREPGNYTLRISGCDTRTASVRVASRACVLIPNIITPNHDQHNDRFSITGLTGEWALQLYNRWGRQVFTTAAYRHDWGADAAPGVYYYILRQATTGATYKGWLEVAR
ncbi:T9SS type B sorting domain-containing protein [Hymenobacter convexus]|uniref:T9SS type B sorting domain-containing protein n=1 Tax=Hymenobacter sp. CA1UV-4 TaxID=3063782 RepID=UPI00271269CF|nr:gliding motility-associated C-terminal domain-containing protein [Hymenobacter sp. CA1UV-4]MDO7853734.1 gliding motility-associated C-terminal domain-containing protein [Hymenobacter sp. CA1UV-4]